MTENAWLEVLAWIFLGGAVFFGGASERAAPWKWRACLAISFLAFRGINGGLDQENSPDESQCLAGAMTLWSDAVFWRSVDGATAGPLHYYMLMPAALAPAEAVYAAARLTGYVVQLATFFLLGGVVRRFDPKAEPVVIIGSVTAFGLSRATDLAHASTELVPNFLLAGAVAVFFSSRASTAAALLTGVALGAVPWAKLQAAPIALAVGVLLLACELGARRSRRAGAMLVGALLPSLGVATMLTTVDRWADMLVPYVFANASYSVASNYTIWSAARGWGRALVEDGFAATWLVTCAVLVLVALIARARWKKNASGESGAEMAGRREFWLMASWLVLAIGCILAARRPFLHYWHLSSVPLALLAGSALAHIGLAWPGRNHRRTYLTTTAFCLAPLVVCRVLGDDHFAGPRQLFARFARENRELAARMGRCFERRDDDRMAIWGKRSDLYLAAGLRQATRQAHSELQMTPGEHQRYFLRSYWDDFARTRPVIFADATGAGNLGFDTLLWRHEAFRPLAEEVRQNYQLVEERFGVRIYVRRERFKAAGKVSPARS